MFTRSRLFFSRTIPLRNVFNVDYQNNTHNNARFLYSITATRSRSTTPLNTIVMFVPQQEAWIVERMGKFHRILEPGLNLLWPIVDKIKYVQSLKEIAIDVPKQSAITSDNVTLSIDGVLYLRIIDPYLASYGVEDPEFAITQLAQTTMRSELGDIKLPTRVHEAMQMQVEAERRKRAAILESEGVRAADINVAEGKRQARILASEAEKQEQINKASGEAQAMLAVAEARARGLKLIGGALAERAMSIYSTVTAHNTQTKTQPDISESYEEPLVKLNALTEKGSTLAGPAIANYDDTLAEYFSDDEEREKALRGLKEKKDLQSQQQSKLEKDT
ncbi:hypothetical protein HF086_008965 [Spodoptera exigua]|uniref:Band 7 domain-containing protein n=1 Tax=Spodoptera exigua TaxID=7107 RepID=A0A922MUG3_SPOEX|nr:hypothetical protein HF086_008965 [Spodoptera exigua]